jgi:hypothetical protein
LEVRVRDAVDVDFDAVGAVRLIDDDRNDVPRARVGVRRERRRALEDLKGLLLEQTATRVGVPGATNWKEAVAPKVRALPVAAAREKKPDVAAARHTRNTV